MTLLGSAHLDKIVPDSDPQQGIDYLQRAAAQGDDTARARLGTAYLFGADGVPAQPQQGVRSEEHTSELQSLMRISYAVFCLKKKKHTTTTHTIKNTINYVMIRP